MDSAVLVLLSAIAGLIVADIGVTIANARAIARLEQAFKNHLKYLHGESLEQ